MNEDTGMNAGEQQVQNAQAGAGTGYMQFVPFEGLPPGNYSISVSLDNWNDSTFQQDGSGARFTIAEP